ncbi:hypothetical protein NDU88_007153 [Pleurodeles waltl]|uniref:Uncharacterized protein n=1 Tax=Pleurodeles waltl TaxID=8319 RepID=A0AAV7N4J5_PLEWA|nr:hypothetical protein NDU88_007153 [Pleurodeles waltl]
MTTPPHVNRVMGGAITSSCIGSQGCGYASYHYGPASRTAPLHDLPVYSAGKAQQVSAASPSRGHDGIVNRLLGVTS